MEVLRDPATASIAAIGGVLVLVLLARFGRRRKELSFEILSTILALTPRDELEGRLKITFEGRTIKDVWLVVVQLFNSGNEAILATDFVQPLSIDPTRGVVLSAEVIETIPTDLNAQTAIEAVGAKLTPLLLNPGDVITLRLVITEYHAPVLFTGRIIGVSRLK